MTQCAAVSSRSRVSAVAVHSSLCVPVSMTMPRAAQPVASGALPVIANAEPTMADAATADAQPSRQSVAETTRGMPVARSLFWGEYRWLILVTSIIVIIGAIGGNVELALNQRVPGSSPGAPMSPM